MLCAGAAFPQSSPSNGVAPPPAATPPSASLPQTSQVADAETTRALDDLASRAMKDLSGEPGAILVLDFKSADGRWLPFGTWLGDQLAAALARQDANLQVLDRSRFQPATLRTSPVIDGIYIHDEIAKFLKKEHAETVVAGFYGVEGKGLAVTLLIDDSKKIDAPRYGDLEPQQVHGTLTLSPDVVGHLGVSLTEILPEKGPNGFLTWPSPPKSASFPVCTYCPAPRGFPSKIPGTIFLSVVITPDGKAEDVSVIRGLSVESDRNAVEAVQGWRFRPARDELGRPFASATQVEVSYLAH